MIVSNKLLKHGKKLLAIAHLVEKVTGSFQKLRKLKGEMNYGYASSAKSGRASRPEQIG